MKRILKALRKNWIKLWLVIAAVAFTSIFSYAAFTRVNIVKRVISTDEGVGDRFSSDHMKASGIDITRESFSATDVAPSVHVHVFNYPYPKSSFYRNSDTTYTLTARLGTMSGTTFTLLNAASLSADEITLLNQGGYKISLNGGTPKVFSTTSLTQTFEDCTIALGSASSDDFTLTFDISEITSDTPNEYYMELVAVPNDAELPTLTGYVSVRYARAANNGWNGVLETLDASKSYDGFNYIVSGSGKGEISFKWKCAFVSINKQFLENKNYKFKVNGTTMTGSASVTTAVAALTPDANGYISITLIVDSSKKNRYEVQFFKTGAAGADYTGSMNAYLPPTSETDWVADTDD